MTNKYKEIEKIKFEYVELTEEFIAELDDKTVLIIAGGNRGKWAQLFNAKEAPVDVEPVAYNHHFMDEYDLMPEEVLSHSPVIPAIMGCKYAGKTDKLYTHPPADKDAERYRWLRKQPYNHGYKIPFIGFNEGIGVATLREKQADEAIDKAMGEV